MRFRSRVGRLERAVDGGGLTVEQVNAGLDELVRRVNRHRRLAAYLTLTGAPAGFAERCEALLRGDVADVWAAVPGALDVYSPAMAERECRAALARGRALTDDADEAAYRRANVGRFAREYAEECARIAAADRAFHPPTATRRALIAAHCGPTFDAIGLPAAEVDVWLHGSPPYTGTRADVVRLAESGGHRERT
jgi:hypothetical protein